MPRVKDAQRYRKIYSYYRPKPIEETLTTGGVDETVIQGLDWKQSVIAATISNLTTSLPTETSPYPAGSPVVFTLDGVTLEHEDRVLIKDQTTASQNGIYLYYSSSVAGTYWFTRALDAEQDTLTAAAAVFVEEGTNNADSAFVLTTNDPITVGTTAQTWVKFAGAGSSIFNASGSYGKTVYSVSFDSSNRYNDTIGSDVFFFVSGSVAVPSGANRKVAVFGGDLFISGNVTHGTGSTASGLGSHAGGYSSVASGQYSHAEGYTGTASGNYSHAEGNGSTASGTSSHAEGSGTTASGDNSHAEGSGTTAAGVASHAEGSSTTASGDGSHAEGSLTAASGINSHAEGFAAEAIGNYSHAEGSLTKAVGLYSHAAGSAAKSWGDYSYAGGLDTVSSGTYQHVVGQYNSRDNLDSLFVVGAGADDNNRKDIVRIDLTSLQVTGSLNVTGSLSQGFSTMASGEDSHAQGSTTTASGDYSHAEGVGTTASATGSHAEGYNAATIGLYSHAEGHSTTATGDYSHAAGYGTDAIGDYSYAGGNSTRAAAAYQHVVGQFNLEGNSDSLFVVGDGPNRFNRNDVLRVNVGTVQVTGSLVATLGLSGSLTTLSDGTSYLIAGTGISVASSSNGGVTISAVGAGVPGGANTSIQYNDSGAFTGSLNFTYSGYTVNLTGSLLATLGLSGSLTNLADGTSYLVAGTNVTITSASNGQVMISSTGGGGGGGPSYFDSTTAGSIFTTGSAAFIGASSTIDSPSDIGPDVFFYVSGTVGSGSFTQNLSLFGGDVVSSGSWLMNVVSGTVSGTYAVGLSDHLVVFTYNVVTATLPLAANVGTNIVFKDGTGAASTSPQMLSCSSGIIDGAATYTLPAVDYTAVTVVKVSQPDTWVVI